AVAWLLLHLIPQVLTQITQLAGQLPAALTYAGEWFEERTGATTSPEVVTQVNAQIADFVGRFVPLAFNLIALFAGSFVILFLAIFLAAQPEVYRDLLLRLVPPPSRVRARNIYDETGRNLRNWVIGKAVTMVMTGIFIWLG